MPVAVWEAVQVTERHASRELASRTSGLINLAIQMESISYDTELAGHLQPDVHIFGN